MAILLTLFQCDNCPKIKSVKTDEDWQELETTWWEGIKFQFCPECRKSAATVERRRQDEQLITQIEERFPNENYVQQ